MNSENIHSNSSQDNMILCIAGGFSIGFIVGLIIGFISGNIASSISYSIGICTIIGIAYSWLPDKK